MKYEIWPTLPNTNRRWHVRAACRNVPASMFFAEPVGPTQTQAHVKLCKDVCASCPVRVLCLEQAMDNFESEWIWGGLTPDERKKLRRDRKRLEA